MTRTLTVSASIFCIYYMMTNAVDAYEGMTLANNLGTVIASEQICGLRYEQDAIERYIESNVPATDMQFASMLSMMVAGTKFQFEKMTESQKTAHCAQIKRSARANGFIK